MNDTMLKESYFIKRININNTVKINYDVTYVNFGFTKRHLE